jgi:hypothetical protein
MVKSSLAFVAVVVALGWSSPVASAATAQRAMDTRDPDGDGIYCESDPR